MEPTERIAVIRRLIRDYGEMMWQSGQGYDNHTDTWNTFHHHAESKLDNLAVELTALRAEVTDYKAKAKHYAKRTSILAEALADAVGKVMAYSNDPQLVRMVNDILLRAAGMKQ